MKAAIPREEVKGVIELAQVYFPTYGREHWHRLEDLKANFKSHYPFSLEEAELPKDLIGIFVPKGKPRDKSPDEVARCGTIVLNTRSGRGMHLSTIAHENGHLFTHFKRLHDRTLNPAPKPDFFFARSEDLSHILDDPDELLADFIAAMGSYPRDHFTRAFCNRTGKVRGLYRRVPIFLFLRAILYIRTHYKELMRNFFSTDHKLFQLCLTLHYIRLRVFLYEEYGL